MKKLKLFSLLCGSLLALSATGIVFAQYSTPTVLSFTVQPASAISSTSSAFDVRYTLSNTSGASGVNLTVSCQSGLTVSTVDDGGQLTPFTCGDIAPGGANGYFAYVQWGGTFVFTNSTNQGITANITLSAHGMNSRTASVYLPPTVIAPSVTSFYSGETDSYGGSVYFTYATANADNANIIISPCPANLSIINAQTGTVYYCGDVDRQLQANGTLFLKFQNNTGAPLVITATLEPKRGGSGYGATPAIRTFTLSTYKVLMPTSVACSQEARQCSDGNYVSRTGPGCEFASCPAPSVTPPPSTNPGNSSSRDQLLVKIQELQSLLVVLLQQLIQLLNQAR